MESSGHAGQSGACCASAATLIVEPEDGCLACGMIGPGRLADPERIADAVGCAFPTSDRSGGRNRSGHGRARRRSRSIRCATSPIVPAARWATRWPKPQRRAGRDVILVSGPVSICQPPAGVTVVHVRTAREMREAVMRHLAGSNHRHQSAAVGGLSPRARAPAEDEENRRRAFRWNSIRRRISWPKWAGRRATAC